VSGTGSDEGLMQQVGTPRHPEFWRLGVMGGVAAGPGVFFGTLRQIAEMNSKEQALYRNEAVTLNTVIGFAFIAVGAAFVFRG